MPVPIALLTLSSAIIDLIASPARLARFLADPTG